MPVTERTDPLEHAWSYSYNTHGDRTTATSPLGHETSYAHDDGFTPVLTADARR